MLAGDVLEGLALMDAIAGDGDPFYEVRTTDTRPGVARLTATDNRTAAAGM